jgi:hypothetical protein
MTDERSAQKAKFQPGVEVYLADRSMWFLPGFEAFDDDQDFLSLLSCVSEAEDQPSLLFAELALTILLLTRNYELSPDDLRRLLTFEPDDPALSALQSCVHEKLVVPSLEARLGPS